MYNYIKTFSVSLLLAGSVFQTTNSTAARDAYNLGTIAPLAIGAVGFYGAYQGYNNGILLAPSENLVTQACDLEYLTTAVQSAASLTRDEAQDAICDSVVSAYEKTYALAYAQAALSGALGYIGSKCLRTDKKPKVVINNTLTNTQTVIVEQNNLRLFNGAVISTLAACLAYKAGLHLGTAIKAFEHLIGSAQIH